MDEDKLKELIKQALRSELAPIRDELRLLRHENAHHFQTLNHNICILADVLLPAEQRNKIRGYQPTDLSEAAILKAPVKA